MADQTSTNVLVAIARESTSTPGTPAAVGAADCQQMRIVSGGLKLDRGLIQSAEKRSDGFADMPRLGGKSGGGTFDGEVSVGGATDILLEAIMRSTWGAAATITQATMTSITTTTSTIVAAGGDWITQGVRVGDVVTLTGHATTANNNLRLRVTGVTTSTITVAGTPLTVDASADNSFTLTILKKLKAAATPTHYTHTVEQYRRDIDLSERFDGCKLVGVKLSLAPKKHVTVQYTFQVMDRTLLATGTSPYFTSPALTTGLSVVADDAAIYKNGVAVVKLTAFDLDFALDAKATDVIGALVTPGIFDTTCTITGAVKGVVTDYTNATAFDAETTFDLSILLQETVTAPKPCLGIFLPFAKFGGWDAPALSEDGAAIESLSLLVGPRAAATGYDATPVVFHSSAA